MAKTKETNMHTHTIPPSFPPGVKRIEPGSLTDIACMCLAVAFVIPVVLIEMAWLWFVIAIILA